MPWAVGVRFASLHRALRAALLRSHELGGAGTGKARRERKRAPTSNPPSRFPKRDDRIGDFVEQPTSRDRSAPRATGRPVWKDERWAQCRSKHCGHVDVYPIGPPSLRGPGSSSRDPQRLQNQRCKACSCVLGRGAHARALKIPLATRKAMRNLWREMARHTRSAEVSLSAAGRGSPGSKPGRRVPVETSAARARVARRASPPPFQS